MRTSPYSAIMPEIIWRATREKGFSHVCVKCRSRSTCAVRTGWSETTHSVLCILSVYSKSTVAQKTNEVVKCRLGLACADSAGWSETTLYANVRKSLFAYCKPKFCLFVCLFGFYAVTTVFQLFNGDSSKIHVSWTISNQYITSPLS